METQKQIQLLRHHLLDMSKLTHRAVDYAIKGYRLGSPEFCRFVRRSDLQFGELRRRVNALCRKLLMKDVISDPRSLMNEMVTDPDIRFTISALLICDALHAICTAAFEIAHHTMMLLESACSPACEALEKLCHLANRMMCLSIVALFKNQTQHAEAVLQNHEAIARLAGQATSNLREAARHAAIPAALQLAITNSLSQIARQAHTIAEATVYWLAGRRNALQPGAFPRLQPSTNP
jgi:phosphate uptake regulator